MSFIFAVIYLIFNFQNHGITLNSSWCLWTVRFRSSPLITFDTISDIFPSVARHLIAFSSEFPVAAGVTTVIRTIFLVTTYTPHLVKGQSRVVIQGVTPGSTVSLWKSVIGAGSTVVSSLVNHLQTYWGVLHVWLVVFGWAITINMAAYIMLQNVKQIYFWGLLLNYLQVFV